MKIRRSIFWFTAVITALFFLIVWFGTRSAKTFREEGIISKPGENITTAPMQFNTNVPAPTTNRSTVGTIPNNAVGAPRKSKEQQTLEILSAQNDVPIVFYGKIEDQSSNALANVTVNFSVRVYSGYEATVKRGQVISDANGLFTISGHKGESLSVVPNKPGYVLNSQNGGGIYSELYPQEQRAQPDPNNPVVMKMWKLQGGEPLIHFSFKAGVPYDGKPVVFDLHKGKVADTGGDLIVGIQAPLKPDTSQQYDWKATIQPVDGGVISDGTGMELRFQAPDSGYDSVFDIKNVKEVKPWSSTFHGGFYLKSHGGSCYGKFDVGIVIYAIKDGLVPITLDGYINPAGSRNLEIDPKQVTEAHP